MSPALAALTSGVLALPGVAGTAHAQSAAESVSADYSFSYYDEDSIRPSDAVPGTERERYEIYVHQFHVKSPAYVFENTDVDFDLVYESMSGASPYYVVANPAGSNHSPLQVMSGATIEEERVDVQAAVNRYLEDGRFSLAGGVSSENDYLAGHFGFDFEKQFNNKNTVLTTGFTASFDTIEPTDPNIDDRIKQDEKQTYRLAAGLSQIINRRSQVQLSLAYQHSTGYLTDPYKLVWFQLDDSTANESRPDERNLVSLMGRYRHHWPAARASFHVDYRFFADDWEIRSHTFNLAWFQDVFDWLQIVPSARYYSQSEADFFGNYFITPITTGRYYSSDYRLSAFGAIQYGLEARLDFPDAWGGVDLRGTLSYDRYESDVDFAMGNVKQSSPGLVDWRLYSVGISGTF